MNQTEIPYDMNKEVQSIIRNLQNTLSGEPWYGKPILVLLQETKPEKIGIKPNGSAHSQADLLYHMIVWAEYVLSCLSASPYTKHQNGLDWPADLSGQNWRTDVDHFTTVHQQITDFLQTKDDPFLKEMVPETKFNYRFLLNGLIQHNIYHAAQIAYITNLSPAPDHAAS